MRHTIPITMRHKAMLVVLCFVGVTAFAGDGTIRRSARRIPGRYVVVLQPGAEVGAVMGSAKENANVHVAHAYGRLLKGFALEGSEADAQKLARDPRVDFVEEDSIVTAETSWALDRIDQRSLPLDNGYTSSGTGAGVLVVVADTGILSSHSDFGGRVIEGFSAFDDGRGAGDCNGHGTQVASLIAGSTYGVAKNADLVSLRVLDCDGSGSVSTVLAGLDWMMDHISFATRRVVLNMSLSGPPSVVLDQAVKQLGEAGVTIVVAAGNNNEDACRHSPGRVASALTVGATTVSDQRASFSNFGGCVDVFAPGVNVPAATYTSNTAVTAFSGTSAAAPLAAGVAALYLEKYPTASAAAIAQTVVSNATVDVLSGLSTPTTPNRLLFSRLGVLDTNVRGDSQLLSDPSFDDGTTFWISDVCTILNPTGCPPGIQDDFAVQSLPSRTGKTHASLGGQPRSMSVTSEVVTIPATVHAAKLSFYLWVVTKGKSSGIEDVLSVEIRDAAGQLLETVGTFSNLDEGPAYDLRQIDLTAYRGKSIRISFSTQQDKGPATWFLVDDVELNIWK